jgi:hypothetical protein
MRRGALAVVAIALIGGAVATPATAAIKAGSACTKLNQKMTSAGYTYTCIKSGKKLVWSKGVKVVVPKPIPSPTPSPSQSPTAIGDPVGAIGSTPTPSATPTPSPTPTPTPSPTTDPVPVEPKTLDDLIAHPESVSYWAWKKSNQRIASATLTGPHATVLVGPHTVLPNTKLQTALDLTTQIYSGFAHPSSVTAIYYNIEDISWAQQEWMKIALHPQGNEAARMCQTADTCWGALSEIDLRGNGLLLIASKDPAVSSDNHTSGTLESHEYAHAIQSTQFVGTAKEANVYCCSKAYMPWWMVEGNAEFSQAAAMYSTSYSKYLEERRMDTGDLFSDKGKTFTQEWFQNYLDTSKFTEWNKPENNWRMYDVGYLVNEVLASLMGPSITMQLFKDVADGKSWDQVFEANLGISWSEALPKLAAILNGMISH